MPHTPVVPMPVESPSGSSSLLGGRGIRKQQHANEAKTGKGDGEEWSAA